MGSRYQTPLSGGLLIKSTSIHTHSTHTHAHVPVSQITHARTHASFSDSHNDVAGNLCVSMRLV